MFNTNDHESSSKQGGRLRFPTRVVYIGDTPLGGNNPIRVQSMTNTDPLNTHATVKQIIQLAKAGCEYVRLATPSLKSAENLSAIKTHLKKNGCKIPLIADVHFNPEIAKIAAGIVEKVRINPGNFVVQSDKYDERRYCEKMIDQLSPLLKICKEHDTVLRVGVNHGSLSSRMMRKYGDTPLGMVESAIEFIELCRRFDFHDIVVSLKASNPKVMIDAHHLLIERMILKGMDYPLHIGVTEAGDAEEGIVKSAAGIGTLLEEGIGDTIRVSLTGDPVKEIPVAKMLVKRYSNYQRKKENNKKVKFYSIETTSRQKKKFKTSLTIVQCKKNEKITSALLRKMDFQKQKNAKRWTKGISSPDYLYIGKRCVPKDAEGVCFIQDISFWDKKLRDTYPFFTLNMYKRTKIKSAELNFVSVSIEDLLEFKTTNLHNDNTAVLVLDLSNSKTLIEKKIICENFINSCKIPLVLRSSYLTNNAEDLKINATIDFSYFLFDGIAQGLWLTSKKDANFNASLLLKILQTTKQKITSAEYISCPTCGRTSFDVENTLKKIRVRTRHLRRLKIAVMGCVVNGPGEMADADYGYVGSGKGKITLYKGKKIVKKNIDEKHAIDELIELIKKEGDWQTE